MDTRLNQFASDWANLLEAYTLQKSFRGTYGEVSLANGRSEMQLLDPEYPINLPKKFLNGKEITTISQEIVQKREGINLENLNKVKAGFETFQNYLEKVQKKESVHLNSYSVTFSKWATNYTTLARILCVVTFGFFYVLWNDGDRIMQQNQALISRIELYKGLARDIHGQAEKIKGKEIKVVPQPIKEAVKKEIVPLFPPAKELEIEDPTPKPYPEPILGIIFNYLNTQERGALTEWKLGKKVLEESRGFQWDILNGYLQYLEPLKEQVEFQEEWKQLKCLKDFFTKYKIPCHFDESKVQEYIFFHILSIFEIPWFNLTLKKESAEKKEKFLKVMKHIPLQAIPRDLEWLKVMGLEIDKQTVLMSLRKRGALKLECVPKEFFNDREFVLEAISIDGWVYNYLSKEELKNDREIILKALAMRGFVLDELQEKFKNDKEIVLKAFAQDYASTWHASRELKENREFALEMVSKDGRTLAYFPNFLNDKEVVIAALKKGADLGVANIKMRVREVLLEAVSKNGMALQYAPKELRNDREIVVTAIKNNGLLVYASPELRNDKDIALEALSRNGINLEFASDSLKSDKKVVLEAVKNNGRALEFAPLELKMDRDIALAAVKNCGEAFNHIPEELKKDREIVLVAVSKGINLHQIVEEYRKDKEIVLAAFEHSTHDFYHVAAELKEKRDIVLAAVQNGLSLDRVPEKFKNDREIVLTAVTNNGLNLISASESQRDRELIFTAFNSLFLTDFRVFIEEKIPHFFTVLRDARKELIK